MGPADDELNEDEQTEAPNEARLADLNLPLERRSTGKRRNIDDRETR
jgi:hypothetical protein